MGSWQPEDVAVVSEFAESRPLSMVQRPQGRPADVGKNESSDSPPAGRCRHREDIEMPPHTAGEADRPVPTGGFREHEVGAASPFGKLEEFRRPDHVVTAPTDQIAARRVAGMDDRVALDLKAVESEIAHPRFDSQASSQDADGRDQL